MTISAPAARRGLVIYLAIVAALSAPLQFGIIVTDAAAQTTTSLLWVSPLMLVPTVASIIARLVQREGFAELRFRRGHGVGRAVAVAVGLPFVVGVLAYGTAWLTGLVGLQVLPLGMWAVLVVLMLLLNLVVSTGEELGWRGYMLPRMVDAGVPAPLLVSSLVWGLWHVPLFLWGDYVQDGPDPVVVTALLMGTTTALGYILGRLRMDTGNVWPAVLLHVVWNTIIQTVFDSAATGEDQWLWTGETGILTVLTLAMVALVFRAVRPTTLHQSLDVAAASSGAAQPEPARVTTR